MVNKQVPLSWKRLIGFVYIIATPAIGTGSIVFFMMIFEFFGLKWMSSGALPPELIVRLYYYYLSYTIVLGFALAVLRLVGITFADILLFLWQTILMPLVLLLTIAKLPLEVLIYSLFVILPSIIIFLAIHREKNDLKTTLIYSLNVIFGWQFCAQLLIYVLISTSIRKLL